ncbi:MAG: hypothetical protein A3F24_02970 [Candidatus Colwellbacteria bacterium RIFCSPHIGHO2_12_FULL_44_17]|uniref:M23ase beta-sheet core domain-containing protein n=2 Tax=Candidatus Colwelliibacteriota TaxID=1817904 RepID=A0A1G1Z9T9_9BACT|nr:MAG: hypothetical protein A3F24_02970 [Candidatus Colwellbacteria bacterium RIFCSPHIGHO2_12_FULL_44_17]OGY60846.1 MAG: hypothetical protein A3I31_03220 [Candidatus Colwellbacteria bacterium RIFCSPLOWO2_02_FULL_44_20b]
MTFQNHSTRFISFLVLSVLFLNTVSFSFAATPEIDLRRSIDEKAKALQEVNRQIQETQQKLEETEGQKQTLTREIKIIDYNINQLQLGIKSSEITIEKLGLELESLADQMTYIEQEVDLKQQAVAQVLRELQYRDNEDFLTFFLRAGSLANGVEELQSLYGLNVTLSDETAQLEQLHSNLSATQEATVDRKQQVEFENKNLKNRKTIVDDQKKEKNTLLSTTKNQEKIYAEQIDELEKKQAEIAAEVEKIEFELRQKIDPSLLPIKAAGVFLKPVKGTLTQEYGQTSFAKYGYRGGFHNGIDWGAPVGTPVMAAEDGTIVATGDSDQYCRRGAYGKFIVIKHENNLTTLYGHLSRIVVSEGEKVTRGGLIGYVGNTGYATGPHLHFTIYASSTFYMGASRVCGTLPYGGYLNPADYVTL